MTDVVTYTKATSGHLIDGWFTRMVTAVGITIPATLFGFESKLILGLLLLVSIDMITGLTKAKINKQQISSARLSNTVLKLIIYFSLLIGSFVVTWAYPEYLPLHTVTLSFLILIEFKSILENVVEAGIILPPGISDWVAKTLNMKKDVQPDKKL